MLRQVNAALAVGVHRLAGDLLRMHLAVEVVDYVQHQDIRKSSLWNEKGNGKPAF